MNDRYLTTCVLFMMISLLITYGCGRKEITEPENHPPTTPSTPFPAYNGVTTSNDLLLKWICTDQDQDQLSYDVYVGRSAVPDSLIASGIINDSLYVADFLESNVTYYWKVIATDLVNPPVSGPIWMFKSYRNIPPSIPSVLYPSNDAFDIPLSVSLSWKTTDPENDTLSYDIYLDDTYPPLDIIAHDQFNTTIEINNLNDFTLYYWKIVAKDGLNTTSGPIWHFTTKSNINEIAQLQYSVPIKCMSISNNHAFIQVGEYSPTLGIDIMDISNPSSPTQSGFYSYSYPMETWSDGFLIDGNNLYFSSSGIHVIDITNINNPKEVGYLSGLYGGGNIVKKDHYLFLPQRYVGNSGLNAFDISNPTMPQHIGFIATPDGAFNVRLNGNYAYLACANAGLRVIDISDPHNMHEVGSYNDPLITHWQVYSLEYNNNLVYLNDFNNGLLIISVENPANPQLLFNSLIPGFHSGGYSIDYDQGKVALCGREGRVGIFDVLNDMTPTLIGYITLPEIANCVILNNNYMYVASGTYSSNPYGRVRIYKLN